MLFTRILPTILAIVLVVVQPPSEARAALRAGAAKISIVPPFPTLMGGFGARTKEFTGVHDDVHARAMVLDNGSTKLLVIAAELRSVDAELTRLVRKAITESLTISPENILVCATHNHSGPSYHQKTEQGQDEDAEPSLKQFLVKQLIQVALNAHLALVPARAGFAAGQLHGITRNRQQKNDVIDPQVGVMRVEELNGRKTIATLISFTGHPVIIGANNLLLSGEYPGVACRATEDLMGGVAIFLQGACGDITTNRIGDPFLDIERVGRTVAGEAIKVSGLISLRDDMVLKSATKTLTLPARRLPSVDDAKAALAEGAAAIESAALTKAPAPAIELLQDKYRVMALDFRKAQAIADNPARKETELKAEVQVIQLGDLIFGTIPGEIFVENALELRSRVKQDTGQSFCLIGYANGYVGYIVTPRGWETGGYEASVSRVDKDAGRAMTETAMELLHQLGTK